jgi:hypothetical protein
MRDIIADSPTMQELYDLYNRPTFVINSPIQFHELRAKRMIPDNMTDVDVLIEYTKQSLANFLFKDIKEDITYEVDTECERPTITASIFVGRK